MTEPALVFVDDPPAPYRDRLLGAIREEFDVDVLVPQFNHPVLCARSSGTCGIEGCLRPARPTGLCDSHNQRHRESGARLEEFLARPQPIRSVTFDVCECAVPPCRNGATRSGLCHLHYGAWARKDRPAIEQWILVAPVVARIEQCEVVGCLRPVTASTSTLCGQHGKVFRASGLGVADFLADSGPLRLVRSHYDFRGLPPLIATELRFAVQARCDEGSVRLSPSTFAGLANAIRDHAGRDESLLSRPLRHWEQLAELEGYPGQARIRLGFVRFAHAALRRFAEAGSDEWSKDVWDLRTLGLRTPATGKVISFEDFSHPWLRETMKRWCRQRLARFKVTTVTRDLLSLQKFGRYLSKRHPFVTAEDLGRDHILGFVDFVRRARRRPEDKVAGALVARVFIEDCRRFGWLDLRPEFAVYLDDLPKLPELAPRVLDEFVMSQLERPGANELLKDNGLRGLVVLVMRTGLRANDACRLRLDALEHDGNGAPYLAFFMHKMNKDHRIPIDDRTAAVIVEQQARVRQRYGTSPFLFPRVNNNPEGQFPFDYSYLRTGLTEWVAALGVTDRDGQRVKITLHQFRHTVGTRMIQELPQHVVQRMLGHDSPQMTAHYARLHDRTLRAAFDQFAATRIDIYGRHIDSPDGEEAAEAQWTKERIARAKQTLPNGYCGRPIQQECPHPNACLTCSDFLTDSSFLELHRDQRERTRKLIAEADADGRFRLVEMNQQVLDTLDTVIVALEQLQEPSDAR